MFIVLGYYCAAQLFGRPTTAGVGYYGVGWVGIVIVVVILLILIIIAGIKRKELRRWFISHKSKCCGKNKPNETKGKTIIETSPVKPPQGETKPETVSLLPQIKVASGKDEETELTKR